MPKLQWVPVDLLPSVLVGLIESAPLASLGPGPVIGELGQWLKRNGDNASKLPPLSISALWLLAGDLDASHEISQSIPMPDGSFWHGIMHRREGDFWNAKYWFRKVGDHPVLRALKATNYGDAEQFVDRCEKAVTAPGTADCELCKQLQWLEWQHMFVHSLATQSHRQTL